MVQPTLTTVRKDIVEVGRRSGRILLSLLADGHPADQQSVVLPTELVIRGSTGPAPSGSPS